MRNKALYPENWVDTIRPDILKRENYKCKKCGIKHRAYVLVDSNCNRTVIEADEHKEYKEYGANTYRIFLQVCHLDHDKSNCDYSNLLAMCPTCHNLHDREHKRLMRLADKKKEKPSNNWIGGSIANVNLIG